MINEDVLRIMAQARGCSVETMYKLVCQNTGCQNEQCVDYQELCAQATTPKRVLVLPTDAKERNEYPMFDGLFGYFPNALAAVSNLSFVGNEQHNPGEPLHWAIGKSMDHANKIVKHLVDHGHPDTDGTRHSTKLAWRALALLEDELVAAGAPRGRNAY